MQDNYDKLKLEKEASEKGINAIFTSLTSGLESLGKEIETLTVSLQTVDEKISSLEEQSQDLNAELTQLKQEHQSLDQEVSNKTRELDGINEELENLQHEKNTLEAEISNKERDLAELETEISGMESDLNEIKDKLVNAEQIREEKVGTIETEVNDIKHKIETKSNQYKVLRHFLDSGYETSNYYNVIKSLKQPGLSTIDQLVLSSGVGRAVVEETLNDLERRGVVTIDDGSFKVVKDFEI